MRVRNLFDSDENWWHAVCRLQMRPAEEPCARPPSHRHSDDTSPCGMRRDNGRGSLTCWGSTAVIYACWSLCRDVTARESPAAARPAAGASGQRRCPTRSTCTKAASATSLTTGGVDVRWAASRTSINPLAAASRSSDQELGDLWGARGSGPAGKGGHSLSTVHPPPLSPAPLPASLSTPYQLVRLPSLAPRHHQHPVLVFCIYLFGLSWPTLYFITLSSHLMLPWGRQVLIPTSKLN